ncbi:DUF4936 family protein [Caldimonas brevitalea]|uniref:DUF4936 family protein n=1 Tax=Caldimonas brevitalea TaxID=413882 RepID=A0A0G3BJA6_9BURK|nr:DUF4936 family protein [Caldimonas brevitalea]AKJ29534.1 hypothetical protein AAW51_2843 [Caldimonas brevitalea]
MRRLFIYYRIASADSRAALQAAQVMQQALRDGHAGLSAELWRRPEEKDGMLTWMEIYTHPAGVDAALEAAIADAAKALAPWLQSPRHVEAFVPCAW